MLLPNLLGGALHCALLANALRPPTRAAGPRSTRRAAFGMVRVKMAEKPPDGPALARIWQQTIASHQPNSYAATPIEKRLVAVCGAGGACGSLVYGAVQRAAQCFDAGLKAPRALVGAARGSRKLNGVLATNYVLAFAGEDLVKRCDFREVGEARYGIAKCLGDCATIVTPCRLRGQGAFTGTEWTWDMDFGGDFDAFERVVEAAPEGAHVVAVAAKADAADAQRVLEASGACHTLLVVNTVEATPRWNLNKGVSQTVGARSGGASAGDIQAEDLGAVIAQACVVLDPGQSRVLSLGVVAEGADQVEAHAAINKALLAPM